MIMLHDIKQLYIGPGSTLGIITRAAIACVRKSSHSYTVALAVQDFQNVPNVLHLEKKTSALLQVLLST